MKTHNEIPDEIKRAVVACAKGSYQTALIFGLESWAGSGLKGVAKKWGGKYAKSRASLLSQIDAAVFEVDCWEAYTALVPFHDGKQTRYHRKLVLLDRDNNEYEW